MFQVDRYVLKLIHFTCCADKVKIMRQNTHTIRQKIVTVNRRFFACTDPYSDFLSISAARDFKDGRALENYDVVKYQYKSCHWEKRHLRIYKSDNGYRLHQSNCIIDVKVGRVHDTIFRFIYII